MTDALTRRIEDTSTFEKKYAKSVFAVWSEHGCDVEFLGYHKSHSKAMEAVSKHYHEWHERKFGFPPFMFGYRSIICKSGQEVFTFGSPRYSLCPVKLRVASELHEGGT